jgi:hypothetical protein
VACSCPRRALRPPGFVRVARNRWHGALMPGVEVRVSYSPSDGSVESTPTATRVRGLELTPNTPRSPVGNELVAPRPKSSASEPVRSILEIKVSGIRYAITGMNVRTEPTAGLSVGGAVRPNAIRDYRAVCRRHPQVKSLSDARIGRGHHNPQGPRPAPRLVGRPQGCPTTGTSLPTATAALPDEDSKLPLRTIPDN